MKSKGKMVAAAAITAAMILSASTPIFADSGVPAITVKAEFRDVGEKAYYYTPVYWTKGKGITVGTSDTTYSPNQPCTRGQMAMFLWRMNGSPEPEKTGYYQDVTPTSNFAKAIAWAKENGITSGTTTATFTPGRTCTRGEMATFLYKQSDSPSVDILKWVVDKAAWDETVVDKPAYDEQVLVQAAWDEPVYGEQEIYHCNGCRAVFYSWEDVRSHGEAAVAADPWSECGTYWEEDKQVQTGTTHHDAVYQTVHHDAVTHVVHHEATGHWA